MAFFSVAFISLAIWSQFRFVGFLMKNIFSLLFLFSFYPFFVEAEGCIATDVYAEDFKKILAADYIVDEGSVDFVEKIRAMEDQLMRMDSLSGEVDSHLKAAASLESKLRKIIVEGGRQCLNDGVCSLDSMHIAVHDHLGSLVALKECIEKSCDDYFGQIARLSGTGSIGREFIMACERRSNEGKKRSVGDCGEDDGTCLES